MGKTSIAWVVNPDGTPGHTVNPIRFRNKTTGKVGHYCEKLSAGCKNCYASAMQKPYLSGLEFTAENKGKGELFFDESVLESVIRRRKPTSYFWCDCTDLFGPWVPDEWIDRCFAVCALTPQHRHMFLTKRVERMRDYCKGNRECDRAGRIHASMGVAIGRGAWGNPRPVFPLPNVWIGVSCEDQATADERIPLLLQTPAAVRFISLEPMLGPVDLRGYFGECYPEGPDYATGKYGPPLRGLDWVIVGGESGPGARPMHPDWGRSVQRQCQAAGVPFFFKQWGEWAPADKMISRLDPDYGKVDQRIVQVQPESKSACANYTHMNRVGKRAAGRALDNREWNNLPEVRESG